MIRFFFGIVCATDEAECACVSYLYYTMIYSFFFFSHFIFFFAFYYWFNVFLNRDKLVKVCFYVSNRLNIDIAYQAIDMRCWLIIVSFCVVFRFWFENHIRWTNNINFLIDIVSWIKRENVSPISLAVLYEIKRHEKKCKWFMFSNNTQKAIRIK